MHSASACCRCMHLLQLGRSSLQIKHRAGAVCVLQFTTCSAYCSRMAMPKLRLLGRRVQELSRLRALTAVSSSWQAPAPVLFWLQPRLRCLIARVPARAC